MTNNVDYYTLPEAAQAVGRDERTIRNWRNRGLLKAIKGLKYGCIRTLIAKVDIEAIKATQE